jgi:hypothetical protein
MPDPEMKQQNGQGMEVSLGGRIALPPHQFRCHVLHRPPDLALGLPVDPHIIVITDEHVPAPRVKHQVAIGDIPVTVPVQMQGTIAVGQLVRDGAEGGKGGDRFGMGLHLSKGCEPRGIDQAHGVSE